ncbi:2-dehydropantoate 2-reductase [Pedobacter ginsengiterrae]
MENKNITVIGTGGVGGYFGFKLCQYIKNLPAYSITLVARGLTYEAIKENGLTLISPENPGAPVRPDRIIESLEEVEPSDLILICVKEYDLEKVCLAIRNKISSNTIVIALMNGADIYERVRKVINTGTYLPCCIYVASHIKEKGIIEHKGPTGKIIIGRDPENKQADINWVIDLFRNSGADIILKENSFVDIWTKFVFISSFGLVSARYNKSIGQVCGDASLRERTVRIMEEIQLIASELKVGLPTDIVSLTLEKARSFPYDTPTSLQLDINSKKGDNELELFAGAIIGYGKKLGIETNETSQIYSEIRRDVLQILSKDLNH